MLLLFVALCLVPWAWRNYRVFGAPMLRGNLGLELWVSNGSGAAFDVATNLGNRRPHPSTNLQEAALVAQLGEAAYDRLKLQEARLWIRRNPGEFLNLTAPRTMAWWFSPAAFSYARLPTRASESSPL